MRVRDVMTKPVNTCKAADPLDAPARIMRDQGCGCVVVVDEQGRAVSMVTDRDIFLCALETMRSLHLSKVSEAMSPSVATCRPDDTVAAAEAIMGSRHVRRVPVVDEQGKPVGLLSLDDLAWAAARTHGLLSPPVTREEVGATLAEVAHPRVIVEAPSGSFPKREIVR